MVGKVTVRSQGPVRRKQTTTTFKKGGRVKLMGGGSPSEMQMMTPREQAEYKMNAKKKYPPGFLDRSSRKGGMRLTGEKKKTAKKYAMGGAIKKVRSYIGDVKDATKKLSPHQDPKSERSAKMRHSLDNPKKLSKKSPSPHSPDKKKRTLKDTLRPKMGPKGGPKGMKPKMGPKGAKKMKK